MKTQSKAAKYFQCLTPVLVLNLKNYNRHKLLKDIISGLIVGIISLPLSLALAIASGAPPEVGLITAIMGGGIAALFSGSRFQVSGPTAAFIPIVLKIATDCGPEGFLAAIFLAGIILLIMGFLKLGKLINYISLPIVAGFTAGIAVSIFTGQLADFMGYTGKVPKEFFEKLYFYAVNIGTVNIYAIIIGVACVAIMLVMPKINKKIPGALVAIVFAVLIQVIFKPDIETIGSRFGELQLKFRIRRLDFSKMGIIIMPAVSIALLAAIESLLSAKAADSMTKTLHNPNAELISQGVANISSSLFGGLPVTGAIARTSANIKNGGVTPLSTVVHALFLLFVGLVLMPLATLIPLTALSAVLIVVCKNMVNIKEAKKIMASTRRDIILFFTALTLTVIFDLVVAILSGMVLALLSVLIQFIIAKSNKRDYRLSVDVTDDGKLMTVTVNGALNFITDARFKLEYQSEAKEVLIDIHNAFDLDLQGYMVIKEVVKRMLSEGRAVKVIGSERSIHCLYRINYDNKDKIDLTDILVEQSMLTFSNGSNEKKA
mgnify:CR=1 FL=1